MRPEGKPEVKKRTPGQYPPPQLLHIFLHYAKLRGFLLLGFIRAMQTPSITSTSRAKGCLWCVRGMRPAVHKQLGFPPSSGISRSFTRENNLLNSDLRRGTPPPDYKALQAELSAIHETFAAAIRLLGRRQATAAVRRILGARRSNRALSLAFNSLRHSLSTRG